MRTTPPTPNAVGANQANAIGHATAIMAIQRSHASTPGWSPVAKSLPGPSPAGGREDHAKRGSPECSAEPS